MHTPSSNGSVSCRSSKQGRTDCFPTIWHAMSSTPICAGAIPMLPVHLPPRVEGIRRGLDSAGECEQQQAIVDLKFVFRNLPGVLSPVDWQSWGSAQPERAEQADHSAIVDLVRTSEGDESAVHARRWLERQPEGFFVLRDTDGSIRGVLGLLELSRASPEDVRADPATRAAWDFARRTAPSRPGECVAITRIVIDRADYQNPSPTMNSVPVLTFQRYFTLPHLSWDFLALAEPDRWNEYFAVADLPRAEGADFTVGDRHYGLFAHDFRRRDVDEWLTVVTDRALAQGHSGPEPTMSLPLALSEKEFAGAVRNALHDLRRPDLLSRNPLLHTRSSTNGPLPTIPIRWCCARSFVRRSIPWRATLGTTSSSARWTARTCAAQQHRKQRQPDSGCRSVRTADI